jgi:hypothetical protein
MWIVHKMRWINSVMVVLFGWYLVAARSVAAQAAEKPTRLSV